MTMSDLGRVIMVRYLIFTLFGFLFCFECSVLCTWISLDSLTKIYSTDQSQNMKIISRFPQYDDEQKYGDQPHSLNSEDLLSLNSTVDWALFESYGIKSEKLLYLAKIKKGFIDTEKLGTIFDSAQQFVFQLTLFPGSPIFWPVQGVMHSDDAIKFKKLAVVQGPTFYYHWVIDRLPSILLLRDSLLNDPELRLILSNGAKPYVAEYLELLGIPSSKFFVPTQRFYYAEEIYVTTPFLMEPIPKKLLLQLRDELLEASAQRCSNQLFDEDLIIIIQRREPDRRISNIEQLKAELKSKFPHNKIVVFDASGSISQQIQTINRAKLIIGVMSSGMTNVMFAKKGTTVIEIHPKLNCLVNDGCVNRAGNEWVWWLCSAVGHTYWLLPSSYKLSDARVECPIETFRNILAQI